MEQEQSAPLTSSLSGATPREAVVDSARVVETDVDRIAFGPVANPKRLRLGATPSL
ncbi:conserved hypothetical protein [Frankia sp. AiPs1]|uniref:hypothetical protein n=1 Tax=Frankia sp. AiPa1 TaxID=573492 RepID=UPI00202AF82C|nr:hypothetical protein [Frankia sp. AiPa1]MCL9759189.1 hypothetical protein [Frankia sp. AiPa1]